ncbi:unnamed protein product, partial [marine sediment metagenome]
MVLNAVKPTRVFNLSPLLRINPSTLREVPQSGL